ncbi:hypothetical protein D3C71_1380450 [compost metagenome]
MNPAHNKLGKPIGIELFFCGIIDNLNPFERFDDMLQVSDHLGFRLDIQLMLDVIQFRLSRSAQLNAGFGVGSKEIHRLIEQRDAMNRNLLYLIENKNRLA